jgi:hypothetical protein
MERGLEFLDEFLQLFRIDVADGKELETLCTPALDVETLHRLGPRPVTFGGTSLRDEDFTVVGPFFICMRYPIF